MRRVFVLVFFVFLLNFGCISLDFLNQKPTNQPPISSESLNVNNNNLSNTQNKSNNSNDTLNNSGSGEVLDVIPTKEIFVNETEPQNFTQKIEIIKPKIPHDIAEIYFFDVGFGDATLIRTNSVTILIGSGPKASSFFLVEKLKALGVKKIDEFILDSWLDTKIGGAPLILKRFTVERVWAPRNIPKSSLASEVSSLIKQNNIVVYNPVASDILSFGELKIEVLNPPKEDYFLHPEANSIVLRIFYGNFCLFLTSDIDQELEPNIISLLDNKTCQIFKWRKNGEGRPTPSILFDRLKPNDVIISVGPNPNNLYPSSYTLTLLQIARVGVYRTDLDKDIFINASTSGVYYITTKADLKNLGEWYSKTDAAS
ncbi:MAG: MBL fold metallo-hydrolase [Candidatus Anstonellaceae archaeon]